MRSVGREVQIINEILNSSVDGSKYPIRFARGLRGLSCLDPDFILFFSFRGISEASKPGITFAKIHGGFFKDWSN